MFDLETKKEMEIKKMVTILRELDLTDIDLMNRDADTLLARKKRAELESQSRKIS